MISYFTLIISTLLILFYYLFHNIKRKNYPKGPLRIPFFGTLMIFGNNPFDLFTILTKKYNGEIFSIKLGKLDCIVLNKAKMIREAFNEPAFTGRPDLKLFTILSKGKNGIIFNDGEEWEEQRRYTIRHLRDFGFGRISMENLIMEEVKDTISILKRDEGKSIILNNRFSLAVLNSLWSILTGNRFNQEDPKLFYILRSVNETFTDISESGVGIFMEWVLEWFPEITGWNKINRLADSWLELFKNSVEEHKKHFNPESEPVDFVDGYLKEIERTTNIKSSFHKLTKGELSLVSLLGDLFGAGSETTSQTLNWMMLYLLTNPDCQKKFQEEIDQVVGKNRLPSLSDRPNMPYTESIIAETLRISSLVPNGVFHSAMKDTKFQGYDIPKGTLIISHLKWVHFDETIWKNPHKFDPSRHLGKDGNFIKNENVIPFSVGKRACLGESLARDEIFLFATSVFQRFNILIDPANPNPSLKAMNGFISIPDKFYCILKDRLELEAKYT